MHEDRFGLPLSTTSADARDELSIKHHHNVQPPGIRTPWWDGRTTASCWKSWFRRSTRPSTTRTERRGPPAP